MKMFESHYYADTIASHLRFLNILRFFSLFSSISIEYHRKLTQQRAYEIILGMQIVFLFKLCRERKNR